MPSKHVSGSNLFAVEHQPGNPHAQSEGTSSAPQPASNGHGKQGRTPLRKAQTTQLVHAAIMQLERLKAHGTKAQAGTTSAPATLMTEAVHDRMAWQNNRVSLQAANKQGWEQFGYAWWAAQPVMK